MMRSLIAAASFVLLVDSSLLNAQTGVIVRAGPPKRDTARAGPRTTVETWRDDARTLRGLIITNKQREGLLPERADTIALTDGRTSSISNRLDSAVTALERASRRPSAMDRYADLVRQPAVASVLEDPSIADSTKQALRDAASAAARAAAPEAGTSGKGAERPRSRFQSDLKVAYNFAGNGSLDDNLQLASHVLLQAWEPPLPARLTRWLRLDGAGIDIIGNLSRPNPSSNDLAGLKQEAGNLLNEAEGLYAGLMPNLRWVRDRNANYSAVAYLMGAVRTNAARDPQDTVVYLQQHRVAAGLVLSFADLMFSEEPGQITVEFFRTRFVDPDQYHRVFGERRSNLSAIDVSLTVPLADGYGLLAHLVEPRSATGEQVYRLGMFLRPPKS